MHQSDVYNKFQMGVSLVSSFTGAASQNMACFVAGTLVLTTAGLLAIEKLKAGDKVLAADPESFEVGEKTILEAFERKVDKLVHLTINGEEVVTTDNHPFYVQGRGFIEAGRLLVGDKLVSVNGEDLFVEEHNIELTEEPVEVYNFNVDDAHTYFVGECKVWVHNADCNPAGSKSVREVESVQTLEDAHSLPLKSKPNSAIQNYKEGNLVTERYYGFDGKPYLDIDYTDHGNPKMHPIVPHEHYISFDSGRFSREKIGRKIKK